MSTGPSSFAVGISRILMVLVGFGLVGAALAQQDNAARDAQIKSRDVQRSIMPDLREAAPFAEGGEEEEFGRLFVLKRPKPWTVTPYASTRGFWTSNALLANAGEKGDSIWVQTEGLSSGYRLTSDWNVFAAYSYQNTRYAENPLLDTDAQNAEFGTTYRLPFADDLRVGTGVRALWMTSPHQNVEIYRENNPYASLINSHGFLDGRLNWFYGYEFDMRYANPVGFDRHEHTLFTGLGYDWLPSLNSQLVLRENWQFYDFRPPTSGNTSYQGRQEHNSSVSLSTAWQPLSWLQISGFGTAYYDNSVNSTRDYKVANLGGEIRAFWQFDLGPTPGPTGRKARLPSKTELKPGEPSLKEPVDRKLEVRLGPRVGQPFGTGRFGKDGTEFDLQKDLRWDDDYMLGGQLDVDWQVLPKVHMGLLYTYDRFDQHGLTARDIYKGGNKNPLLAESTVGGSADIQTIGMTFGYDIVKTKTWVVKPYLGAKGAFIDEELYIVDRNRNFTLSGKDIQEIEFGTPFGGVEARFYCSRNWYAGVDTAAVGWDRWAYVDGRLFTGYDFNENWGLRTGVDVNYASYENSNSSLMVNAGLGTLFFQVVYGY